MLSSVVAGSGASTSDDNGMLVDGPDELARAEALIVASALGEYVPRTGAVVAAAGATVVDDAAAVDVAIGVVRTGDTELFGVDASPAPPSRGTVTVNSATVEMVLPFERRCQAMICAGPVAASAGTCTVVVKRPSPSTGTPDASGTSLNWIVAPAQVPQKPEPLTVTAEPAGPTGGLSESDGCAEADGAVTQNRASRKHTSTRYRVPRITRTLNRVRRPVRTPGRRTCEVHVLVPSG